MTDQNLPVTDQNLPVTDQNLPVTGITRRRNRCGHCRQEGHNRATCPGLAEQRHQAYIIRSGASDPVNRIGQEESKLINFQIHNPTDHIILIFWSSDLDTRTEESQYRYLATLSGYADTILRFSKRHKFITIPMTEFITPPSELNEYLPTPLTQTIFNEGNIKELLVAFHSAFGVDESPLIIINDIKDYKPVKTVLEKWKEAAFKSLFLLTELRRMGASNNENLAPMVDMIDDISLPEHTEMDKELAGVPSTFTNIT
jgi:hypothetical protein